MVGVKKACQWSDEDKNQNKPKPDGPTDSAAGFGLMGIIIKQAAPSIDENTEYRTLFYVALHLAKSFFTGSPQINR